MGDSPRPQDTDRIEPEQLCPLLRQLLLGRPTLVEVLLAGLYFFWNPHNRLEEDVSFKTFRRSFEKRVLRPFARRMKRLNLFSGFDNGIVDNRIAVLEERVELLESLFREQAGLNYLRLAHDADALAEPTTSGVTTRETA